MINDDDHNDDDAMMMMTMMMLATMMITHFTFTFQCASNLSFEFFVWIVDFRLTKPDEEQSCSKLLLLYFNKSTQNEDLQLSCPENLQPTG